MDTVFLVTALFGYILRRYDGTNCFYMLLQIQELPGVHSRFILIFFFFFFFSFLMWIEVYLSYACNKYATFADC